MEAPLPPLVCRHTMLSLALLGPFQATLGDQGEMTFRTRKERALLAYLAVEAHRPHRREALAELLWPGRPEGVSRTSLRQALSGIRRYVGGGYLLATRTTIQLHADPGLWLDLNLFRSHIQAIRSHPHNDPATCPICMGRRQQAVALYRGRFLSGLVLDDSRPFQEWVAVHRERLFRQQIDALRHLTHHRRALGDLQRARRYARRWAELDPLSERAYRQRMAILALSGRRRDALQQFETCRRLLVEELGMEPVPETVALAKQIRAGSLTTDGISKTRPVLQNLPLQLTPFFGRERELARVTRLLSNPDCRLITVLGPGGVGKTRLALRAAERAYAADIFADGVWFVPGREAASPGLLAATIARALDVPLDGEHDPLMQLLEHLEQRTLLLVVDNFEHLLHPPRALTSGRGRTGPPGGLERGPDRDGGVGLLLEILREAPGVRLMVTSRERLNCQAEFLVGLEGLSYPAGPGPSVEQAAGARDADDGDGAAAVELFLERARRLRPDLAPTPDTLHAITHICRLVEGLPLAVELAAAGLGRRTCEQEAQAIQRGLDALSAPLADLSSRQRSVRAAFERSWRLLPPSEQSAYRRLSVFHAGFDPDAAQAIAGETETGAAVPLRALVDKSLLRSEAPAGGRAVTRFDLHPLLRQYAAEKLSEHPGEQADALARHGRFYLAFLQTREADLAGDAGRQASDEVQREMGAIRAAWQWAVKEGQLEELGATLPALSQFYSLQGPFAEAGQLVREAAERLLARADGDRTTRAVACRLRVEQAYFAQRLGDYSLAIQVTEQAIVLAQGCDEAGCEARAATIWGEALWRQGEYEPARRRLEQALTLIHRLPDARNLESHCLNCLAGVSWRQADYGAACQYLEASRRLASDAGDARGEAIALGNLGVVTVEQADYADAEGYYRRALDIEREIGERSGEGVSLMSLGNLSLYLGEYAKAEQRYRQALAIHREIGARQNEAWALGNLGLLAHYRGDQAAALDLSQKALQMSQEIGHQTMQAAMWMKVGHALAALEQLAEAAEAYQESAELRRRLEQANAATEPLAGLARVRQARGDIEGAQEHVQEIINHLDSGGSLDGAISPFQVYLTCFEVLRASHDFRAGEILRTAHDLLQARAAKIPDQAQHRSYLQNVAAHRQIVREFAALPMVET